MTCREMEALFRELALEPEVRMEGKMEPALRPDARAHLAACPRCSAQLGRERRLTASLAALAGNLENCAAPPPMEDHLRAAFREHWREDGREDGKDRGYRAVPEPLPVRSWSLWAGGAAATIVVSLAAMVWVWNAPRALVEDPDIDVSPPASASTARAATTVTTATTEVPGVRQSGGEAGGPSEGTSGALQPTPERAAAVTSRGLGVPKVEEGETSGGRLLKPLLATPLPAKRLPEAEEAILPRLPLISTEFVPFLYGGDPLLLGAGQVWRVEMSRGALESVGMPVNEESRGSRIQVDVLLGEDGIARAIRLVQ